MNIHYFQHVPFEGLGYIEDILKENFHNVTATKFYEDSRLPFIDICDMLIVMGGPMSVHDEKEYPWLIEEKKFIAKAIASGKKVLGVCLGAQLIAEVIGGKVYTNTQKEIGWMPVQPHKNASKSTCFNTLKSPLTVLHWHGETFDLPQEALVTASSAICTHQAFEYNNGQVIGLQFHLEATTDTLNQMLENCGHELVESPYIQKPEQIRSEEHIEACHLFLKEVLAKMCS